MIKKNGIVSLSVVVSMAMVIAFRNIVARTKILNNAV